MKFPRMVQCNFYPKRTLRNALKDLGVQIFIIKFIIFLEIAWKLVNLMGYVYLVENSTVIKSHIFGKYLMNCKIL